MLASGLTTSLYSAGVSRSRRAASRLCRVYSSGGASGHLVGGEPRLQFAPALLHVIHHFGREALLARQRDELLEVLQRQRRFVQGGVALPDDLLGVHVFRVQALGFFEFSQRLFPVALFGVSISQVGANARIGWIEPLRLVPEGNRVLQLALLFGAFAQARRGSRRHPGRAAALRAVPSPPREVPLEHQREAQDLVRRRALSGLSFTAWRAASSAGSNFPWLPSTAASAPYASANCGSASRALRMLASSSGLGLRSSCPA